MSTRRTFRYLSQVSDFDTSTLGDSLADRYRYVVDRGLEPDALRWGLEGRVRDMVSRRTVRRAVTIGILLFAATMATGVTLACVVPSSIVPFVVFATAVLSVSAATATSAIHDRVVQRDTSRELGRLGPVIAAAVGHLSAAAVQVNFDDTSLVDGADPSGRDDALVGFGKVRQLDDEIDQVWDRMTDDEKRRTVAARRALHDQARVMASGDAATIDRVRSGHGILGRILAEPSTPELEASDTTDLFPMYQPSPVEVTR